MEEITFFNNNWKAVEKLGEGTFGTVYKAEKSQYGITSYSAIKQIVIPQSEKEYSILKSEGMTLSDIEKTYDNQVRKWVEEISFLNEFKDNENIVSIEDFEIVPKSDGIGKIINIKMELLQNIDEYVLNNEITDKKILKMALDILNALEDCEEKNVVHRDIKPDNIFVNTRDVYKIGDFGEAKSIEKTVSNMSKKGTENYMAPEIYKGERGSKSVDTYSLGVMLYKYFNNNRLPFLPDYPNQITFQDRNDALFKRMFGNEMKPPVNASEGVSKIILKACSYNVENRYSSAMEFRNDVEKEYKLINRPRKLFDFQNNEIIKEENKDEQDKTEGVFGVNVSKSNDRFDKTAGMFGFDNSNEKRVDTISNMQSDSKDVEVNNDINDGLYRSTDRHTDDVYGRKLKREIKKKEINKKVDNFDKTVGIFSNNSFDFEKEKKEKKETINKKIEIKQEKTETKTENNNQFSYGSKKVDNNQFSYGSKKVNKDLNKKLEDTFNRGEKINSAIILNDYEKHNAFLCEYYVPKGYYNCVYRGKTGKNAWLETIYWHNTGLYVSVNNYFFNTTSSTLITKRFIRELSIMFEVLEINEIKEKDIVKYTIKNREWNCIVVKTKANTEIIRSYFTVYNDKVIEALFRYRIGDEGLFEDVEKNILESIKISDKILEKSKIDEEKQFHKEKNMNKRNVQSRYGGFRTPVEYENHCATNCEYKVPIYYYECGYQAENTPISRITKSNYKYMGYNIYMKNQKIDTIFDSNVTKKYLNELRRENNLPYDFKDKNLCNCKINDINWTYITIKRADNQIERIYFYIHSHVVIEISFVMLPDINANIMSEIERNVLENIKYCDLMQNVKIDEEIESHKKYMEEIKF